MEIGSIMFRQEDGNLGSKESQPPSPGGYVVMLCQ